MRRDYNAGLGAVAEDPEKSLKNPYTRYSKDAQAAAQFAAAAFWEKRDEEKLREVVM